MLKTECKTKYGEDQYEGPYAILELYDNGTVRQNSQSWHALKKCSIALVFFSNQLSENDSPA